MPIVLGTSLKEIIVMKSAGASPLKISKPALLVALVSALILFITSHFILPKTYEKFKVYQNEIRNSDPGFSLKDNVFINTLRVGATNTKLHKNLM